MAAPVLSHLISGTVYDLFGIELAGVTVSIKHVSFDQTIPDVTTGLDGKYLANLSGLTSQWSVGEEIEVTASKTAEGTKTISTIISTGGSQTVNLTLAETSDLIFGENSQDRYNLNFALLTHYDGEKVTRERPFPVSSSEIDLLYNPAHSWEVTNQDGQPESETVTFHGNSYKRTFTYTSVSGARILTTRSKWARQ